MATTTTIIRNHANMDNDDPNSSAMSPATNMRGTLITPLFTTINSILIFYCLMISLLFLGFYHIMTMQDGDNKGL